jgi:hypothetical protein
VTFTQGEQEQEGRRSEDDDQHRAEIAHEGGKERPHHVLAANVARDGARQPGHRDRAGPAQAIDGGARLQADHCEKDVRDVGGIRTVVDPEVGAEGQVKRGRRDPDDRDGTAPYVRNPDHLADYVGIATEKIRPGTIRHDRDARRVAAGGGVLVVCERAPLGQGHAKRVEEALGNSRREHFDGCPIVAHVGCIDRLVREAADAGDRRGRRPERLDFHRGEEAGGDTAVEQTRVHVDEAVRVRERQWLQ